MTGGDASAAAVAAAASSIPVLRAVLFDVDGTLADSDPLHYVAFRDLLQEVGFQDGQPISEDFFNAHISGRHNPDIQRDLFPHWSEEQRLAFTDKKEALFRKLAATSTVAVPGLPRLCEWVQQHNVERAAVTNAPRANAEQMIACLGLSDFFSRCLVIGSECKHAKPHPQPYLDAMSRLGVQPQECFAIEDSPAGIRAAVAAGVVTVGVLTAHAPKTLTDAGASFTLKDYDDAALWQFLQRLQTVK